MDRYDSAWLRALQGLRVPPRRLSPGEVERLGRKLVGQPRVRRVTMIRSSARYGSPGVCNWLMEQAEALRFEDPETMLAMATAAVDVARWSGSVPARCLLMDLRAQALACLGNAQRVRGELKDAQRSLDQAVGLLEAGTGDPLVAARIAGWRGALAVDLGSFEQACNLYVGAVRTFAELDEADRAGRELIRLGVAAAYAGPAPLAVECILGALPLVELRREPALAISAVHALAHLAMEDGQPREALHLVQLTRSLYNLLPGHLAALRLKWAEGRILARTGRLAPAESLLEGVRAGFLEQGMRYDAALVGLELAQLHLLAGRLQEVEALGQESHAVFMAQGVQGRAADAWLLLAEAGAG